MDKIEIGEYVRTKKGQIYISDRITENGIIMKDSIDIFKNGEQFGSTICEEKEIEAHSFCIIDILKEGDFCNSELIKAIFKNTKNRELQYIETESRKICEFKIQTILTKEQYERNCYKVEE